jgi:hypothetical protein
MLLPSILKLKKQVMPLYKTLQRYNLERGYDVPALLTNKGWYV